MDTVEELYNALPKFLVAIDGNNDTYSAWLNIERVNPTDSLGEKNIRIRYMEWRAPLRLIDQRILLEVYSSTLTEGLLDMLCKVKVYRDEHKDI